MNVANTLKLDAWVLDHQEELRSSERAPLQSIAEQVAKKLGFKVNASNLAEIMKAHAIPTRKQSAEETKYMALLVENERQAAEIRSLKGTVAKVLAGNYIPDNLKGYIFGDLPGEMREALEIA